MEKGAAVGVRLATGEEIRAPRLVSAAGVQSTLSRLLPEHIRVQPWSRSVTDLAPAPAHVCLYMGFTGDIRQAGCSGANKWFIDCWDSEDAAWTVSADAEPGPAPVLYCSFPSLKDPQHEPGPDLRHTGEIVTFVPWEAFEPWRGSRWQKRGDDYEAFKKRIEKALLRQFFARLPELEPMLAYAELSTPLSTDTFCRPMSGSIYGIEPTPGRFRNGWLRPKAPIKNLWFSGSEIASVGVIGAMMGGILAAAGAEPRGVYDLVRGL